MSSIVGTAAHCQRIQDGGFDDCIKLGGEHEF